MLALINSAPALSAWAAGPPALAPATFSRQFQVRMEAEAVEAATDAAVEDPVPAPVAAPPPAKTERPGIGRDALAIKPLIKYEYDRAMPFLPRPVWNDPPSEPMAGDVGFDPLGLSQGFSIKWMREAEVKHGRVCMLAFLGYVSVDLGFRAPGAPEGITSLMAHDTAVKSGHMLLLLFAIAVFEAVSYNAISEMMSGETDRQPGDYGFDPLRLSKGTLKASPEELQLAEITHGRAAMIGFGGIVTASQLGGASETFPYFPDKSLFFF